MKNMETKEFSKDEKELREGIKKLMKKNHNLNDDEDFEIEFKIWNGFYKWYNVWVLVKANNESGRLYYHIDNKDITTYNIDWNEAVLEEGY